jgi:hypothetical protein
MEKVRMCFCFWIGLEFGIIFLLQTETLVIYRSVCPQIVEWNTYSQFTVDHNNIYV